MENMMVANFLFNSINTISHQKMNIVFVLFGILINKVTDCKLSAKEFTNICQLVSELAYNSDPKMFENNIRELFHAFTLLDKYDDLIQEINFIKTVNNYSKAFAMVEDYMLNNNYYQTNNNYNLNDYFGQNFFYEKN